MPDMVFLFVLGQKSRERNNTISKIISRLFSKIPRRIDFNELQSRLHFYQKRITDFIKRHRTIRILHVLRNYSALMVVVSSSLLVTSTNIANSNGSNGLLSGYFNNGDNKEAPARKSGQEDRKDNLSFVPLTKAPSSVNPDIKEEADNEKLSLVEGQALTASFGTPLKDPEENGGVKIYEVKPGDTVSGIAAANNITTNTILWANDLDNVDSIMPGDKIFILPIAGLSYTIQKGDNIDSIASKYKTNKEKIIAFNDLPADGALKEGDNIIIPDGQKEVPQQSQNSDSSGLQRRQYATSTGGTPAISGFRMLSGKAGTGHKFPYGYCTWYVAQKRYVPWGGNAGTWLYNAKSAGYQTGRAPRVGAIMVSSESWWGHVAIVESIGSGTFTISEMNYKGWGKVDRRVVQTSSRIVKGFIY
jgi:peptidoglycan DL-endopeptidase CwlO